MQEKHVKLALFALVSDPEFAPKSQNIKSESGNFIIKHGIPRGFCWATIWVFPKIGVPPNHPILIGFSIINHPFWGTIIFGNTHIGIPIGINHLFLGLDFHPNRLSSPLSCWLDSVCWPLACVKAFQTRWPARQGCFHGNLRGSPNQCHVYSPKK